MKASFREFDPSRYLDDDKTALEYLRLTCEDGTAAEIAEALGHIARARGITKVAKSVGMSRQALYKALSSNGNPEFATIAKVADALGMRLMFLQAARAQPELPDSSTKDAA
jgi:probable addiction module antidote protein